MKLTYTYMNLFSKVENDFNKINISLYSLNIIYCFKMNQLYFDFDLAF